MEMAEFLELAPEERLQLLKRLVRDLIPAGEVKELAFSLKRSPYTLYKWRDENLEDHNLIRPELPELFHLTQNLRLLDFLEGLVGRIAFRKPQAPVSLTEINKHIAGVFRECAAACQEVIAAVAAESPAGQEITGEEFKEIEAEIDRAHRELAALKAAARKQVRARDRGPGTWLRQVFP